MFKTKLLQALDSNVNANKARLKSLVLLVSAVLQHRTVNLAILATTNDGKSTSNESRYRRFQDFFLRFSLCLPSVAQAILARVPKPPGGYVLAMDRTNWQFGRRDINFLTIAVVTGKVAIPVVWMALPPKTRQGNSNAAQRIALTEKLLALITSKDIWALVMDREFVGKQWLQWLDKHGVAYVVRLKKNVIVGKQTAEKLATRRGRKSARKQNIFGLELFFSCKTMKSRDRDTHLMVASNRFVGKEALQLYRQRWGIERLFGHLKKKGFDLEATHMTDAAKLEKLF
ncbi:MAG: IS4 family transposase, partial [Verrucomicrobiota bacterium JB023]|nr:IS4 family transposase [Verrucomicrobiota bacterium JB023]